jgi:glycine cleavage system H protein
MMKIQPEFKYTKTDEWVKIDDKIAIIGITDYAQNQLSDIVFLEIVPVVGDAALKGKACATIESVKAASDVNFPLSGTVTEINEALSQTPELINSDPFGAAWMLKIEFKDPSELGGLMDAKAYEAYCLERSH